MCYNGRFENVGDDGGDEDGLGDGIVVDVVQEGLHIEAAHDVCWCPVHQWEEVS